MGLIKKSKQPAAAAPADPNGIPRAYATTTRDPSLPGLAGYHWGILSQRNQLPETRFEYRRPDGYQGEWKARDAPKKYGVR